MKEQHGSKDAFRVLKPNDNRRIYNKPKILDEVVIIDYSMACYIVGAIPSCTEGTPNTPHTSA